MSVFTRQESVKILDILKKPLGKQQQEPNQALQRKEKSVLLMSTGDALKE
jgi:hypothetical protein